MDLEKIILSKSDRKSQLYDISYIWKSKKNDTNESIYKTQTDFRYRKQTYGYQRGKGAGVRDKSWI